VFSGFAWLLQDTSWLFAVLAATAGSIMVSYTRARVESLRVECRGGAMQRAERIVLVAVVTLVAAWFGTSPETSHLIEPTLGIALGLCGALSGVTAPKVIVHSLRTRCASAPGSSVQPRRRHELQAPTNGRTCATRAEQHRIERSCAHIATERGRGEIRRRAELVPSVPRARTTIANR